MRTKTSLIVMGILIVSLGLMGAGCFKTKATPQNTVSQTTDQGTQASITVIDQKLDGDKVTIAKVTTPEDGWIVVHASNNGLPGATIGQAAVSKGSKDNIVVTIDTTKATQALIAMLHYDKEPKGTFDISTDGPVIINQVVIEKPFSLQNFTPVQPTQPQPTPQPTTTPTTSNPPVTTEPATKSFSLTAKNWSFSPSTITVKKGDKVKLTITSVDVEHGFKLPAFNINQTLEPGKTVTVEFTADKAGTFTFTCSVFCGAGHRDMTGTLIVE